MDTKLTLHALALPVLLAPFAGCGGSSQPVGDLADPDADSDSDSDGDPIPEHPDDTIFDEDVIRTYDLEVDSADWEWLNENALLEQYVPANLVFEGKRWDRVGVRYKGGLGTLLSCFDAGGNRTCPKLSIKVKLNEYDPEGRFHDLEKLQFHSMSSDPSQMRDTLAYGLFREMGVVACRTAYARLRVNGEDLGLFVLVEQIHGRFARRHFEEEGGEGNIYKSVWPRYLDEEPYLEALRTNEESDPDVSGMVDFATALDSATDETFLDVLGEWMDVGAIYAYLAVDRGISNWDGIRGWYCLGPWCFNDNYYWYEEARGDRMWLLPWDMDHSFEPSPWETYFAVPGWLEREQCDPVPIDLEGLPEDLGIRPASCDPFVDRLGRVGWDDYVAAARAFLDGPFRENAVLEKIGRYEDRIEGIVAEDANGPGLAEFRAAVDELRGLIPRLRDDLADEIGL